MSIPSLPQIPLPTLEQVFFILPSPSLSNSSQVGKKTKENTTKLCLLSQNTFFFSYPKTAPSLTVQALYYDASAFRPSSIRSSFLCCSKPGPRPHVLFL